MAGYGTPAEGVGPFGQALVAWRAGRDRKDAAALLGISAFTLKAWEQAANAPSRLAFEMLQRKEVVPCTIDWSQARAAVQKRSAVPKDEERAVRAKKGWRKRRAKQALRDARERLPARRAARPA